jgi:hypothetical protein
MVYFPSRYGSPKVGGRTPDLDGTYFNLTL